MANRVSWADKTRDHFGQRSRLKYSKNPYYRHEGKSLQFDRLFPDSAVNEVESDRRREAAGSIQHAYRRWNRRRAAVDVNRYFARKPRTVSHAKAMARVAQWNKMLVNPYHTKRMVWNYNGKIFDKVKDRYGFLTWVVRQ